MVVVVAVVAAADEGRDKALAEWAGLPPGRAAIVSVRRAAIVSHTVLDCLAPAGLAPSVGRV